MKRFPLLAGCVGLALLLATLAGLEYFHHRADAHAFDAMMCVSPHVKAAAAGELYRQHLYGHR